jgi:hypothetical protein
MIKNTTRFARPHF